MMQQEMKIRDLQNVAMVDISDPHNLCSVSFWVISFHCSLNGLQLMA